MLTDVLRTEGRIDQVIDSLYSEETNRIVANEEDSLQIMLKLADFGMTELGEKLFRAFLKDFHGGNELEKSGIITLAQCAGVFKTRPSNVMRWLSDMTIQRDILEAEELSASYAPHLAAYLNGLIRSGRENIWRRLKRINYPFPNQLIRQLTIRGVASYCPVNQLRTEVDEYIATHPDDTNLELGFYAAKSGLSPELVNQLAGQFCFPPEVATHETLRADLQGHILRFAYWAVIFNYAQNDVVIRQMRARLLEPEAVWASIQLHL